jgi:predicted amidohydrolase
MRIDAWTFDVGTTEDHVEAMASRVEQSWDSGADIVLFPEYSWAALPGCKDVREMAAMFWCTIMPRLQQRLARPGKMVVLGTAPCITDGELRNRAPILVNGELIVQDKLYLTPWEKEFSGGKTLHLIHFGGLRIAVIICLDIEIPELSVQLRGQGVDLILVPSATETMLGSERVTRCASARSVELGCVVVVSPVVGKCSSDLVDDNQGRLASYLPSQAVFQAQERRVESVLLFEGFHCVKSDIEFSSLNAMRESVHETNPSLIFSSKIEPPQINWH